jgi:hypothetical protein
LPAFIFRYFLLIVGSSLAWDESLLADAKLSAFITIHVCDHLMKLLKILALSVVLLTTAQAAKQPSFHTKGTPTGKPTGPLKPGEYWWKPQLSPSGPLMVLVSIPEQTMHVYRNGILIGRSSVSIGSKGHATPGGVFSILEKKQEHYSKKYDNAPMPNMQRLTWTGIAMHSGNLPGYPASHACIRMPFDFSQLLFSETSKGGTVVVGDGKTPVPHLRIPAGRGTYSFTSIQTRCWSRRFRHACGMC